MEVQFKNAYLEKLYEGKTVPGKPKYSSEIITKFKKTILKLQFVDSFRELFKHKGLNFESLNGDYKGYHSVRVNRSYRLILSVNKSGSLKVKEIVIVHDLNNHYQ
jgi:toxin HigB-1